jgi:Spy/CpxP family protein refolding chaperone
MRFRWVLAVMCLFILAAIVTVRADDKSTTKKSESTGAKGRLIQPYSKMTDLSDDQKDKIKEIHAKALEDIKAIEEKQTSDIMALLSDDQKAEAKKLMAEEKSGGSKKSKSDDSKSDSSKSSDSSK